MKIAVYTIAKNEEKFVKRWAESCKEADYRIILDTGSTDRTVEIAQSLGITVHTQTFNPWRFDTARIASLAHVPEDADYCVALDMDEILLPGWRKHIEQATGTRLRYQYVWSWNPDGTPGRTYWGDKIHTRHGYTWKYPIHEVIHPTAPETIQSTELHIHHHPDPTKTRSSYLPLLELGATEDPNDSRSAYVLARAYNTNGMHDKATPELKRYLSLPTSTSRDERCHAMLLLAESDNDNNTETWLLRAAAEAPWLREPWVNLARHYLKQRNWAACYTHAKRALTITERPSSIAAHAHAWGPLPHDYASSAAFHLGRYDESVAHATNALAYTPNNERRKKNLHLNTTAANNTRSPHHTIRPPAAPATLFTQHGPHVTATFTTQDNGGEPVTYRYITQINDTWGEWTSLPPNHSSINFTHLTEGTTIRISVRAMNSTGLGPKAPHATHTVTP